MPKKDLINDSLTLLADMRVQLMEQLGDPTSTNVLSKSRSDAIFDRLNRELAALAAASGAKPLSLPSTEMLQLKTTLSTFQKLFKEEKIR